MSLFGGESAADKRDYGFAFAALKSTLYLAQMLACQGRMSPPDAREHSQQVRDGLGIVPKEYLSDAGRAAIEYTLSQIEKAADTHFNAP